MSISFRVSFTSEISIQVYMIPTRHFIPYRMKNGMNSIRKLQLNPDSGEQI